MHQGKRRNGIVKPLIWAGIGLLVGVVLFKMDAIKGFLFDKELPIDKINITSQEFKELIRPTFFNIEDFGGSMENEDNSAALQAAIDAAIVTSTELRSDDKWDIYVGKVYIPSGHWKFSEGVSSTIGVEIFGDGVGKSYLEYTGDDVFLDFGSENEKFDLKITDLFIRQYHEDAIALNLNQVNRNSGISNVIIEGGGIGLRIHNCYTTYFDTFFIYNTSQYGILGLNATNTDFTNFKIENCSVGAKFTRSETNSSTGLKFFGGVIQGCANEGLILENLTNFASYATFLEGNGRNLDKSQIYVTSDPDGKFGNDMIAFYSPFITAGHSSHKGQAAILVENTRNIVIKESFIRANDRITTGIKLGKKVINADIINSKFSGVINDFEITDARTNLIYDTEFKEGRGYGRQMLGLGSESGKTNNRHYMESYQGVFGHKDKGKVGIGTFNGRPSLQGFGSGSSYDLTTNPKVGNHISAPNGITEVSGIKHGTTLTASNVKTNKKSRNILVNTDEGKRSVEISPADEEIRRELVIKNTGNKNNALNISSASALIDKNKIFSLKDGEAITLLYDGEKWQVLSLYRPD